MTAKFDEYTDILMRLVAEAAACTPEDWKRSTLTIDSDGARINYRLKNEESPNKARISEKLRDLIDEFYVRMADRGNAWTQSVVTFWREGNGLKFNTSFTYPQEGAANMTTPDASVYESVTPIVTELAQSVVQALRAKAPGWRRAFLRFEASDTHHGCTGSYETEAGVFLFSPFQDGALLDTVNSLGVEMRRKVVFQGRQFCVFLLTVQADLKYHIDYEWANPKRWRITKLDGQSGIPEGMS